MIATDRLRGRLVAENPVAAVSDIATGKMLAMFAQSNGIAEDRRESVGHQLLL
jgi:hypothetical protein